MVYGAPLKRAIAWYAAVMLLAAAAGFLGRAPGRSAVRRAGLVLAVVASLAASWGAVRFFALWQRVGMEMQVLDDERHPDGKRGPLYQAGALYDLVPVSRRMAKPAGEINLARVVARGNHAEHWLNGAKVAEYDFDSADPRDRIAKSKFREVAGFGVRTASPLVLRHRHDLIDHDLVWFRNIKVRPLP
jgi:hypothetical protein